VRQLVEKIVANRVAAKAGALNAFFLMARLVLTAAPDWMLWDFSAQMPDLSYCEQSFPSMRERYWNFQNKSKWFGSRPHPI